jgi:malate dehydrogenase (oxaloacetate-decarboxylating)(NADP+)
LGNATAIGPILVGMNRSVHVLELGADVEDIVNMAAVSVMDAQERTRREAALAEKKKDLREESK